MDFSFSAEDQAMLDVIDRVANEKLRPYAFQKKDEEGYARENLKLLGDLGILGVCVSEEFGGSGRPGLSGMLAIERISSACPRTGSAALMSISGPAMFISKWGSDAQKKCFVPAVVKGEQSWAISLTEPQAGTALTDMKTSARKVGGKYLVNGHKVFCSDGHAADHILLFCRFGEGVKGIGAVIVHRDTPGLKISKPHYHMCGKSWSELFFDDAEIPEEDVLFAGNAFKHLMASYSLERAAAGAWVLGIAQAAFDLAKTYSVEREQFGRPICEFEMVQARLANMYLALEQARLLLYKATLNANGVANRLESSAAKVATTEAACFITNEAIQMFGATGASQDMPLEWYYRLVRPYTIAGGTSDIHRSMIASEIVGRRFEHRAGR